MKKDFNTGLRKGIEADRVKLTRRRKLLLREMGLAEDLDSTELAEKLHAQTLVVDVLNRNLVRKDEEIERLKARIAELEGGAKPVAKTSANSSVPPSLQEPDRRSSHANPTEALRPEDRQAEGASGQHAAAVRGCDRDGALVSRGRLSRVRQTAGHGIRDNRRHEAGGGHPASDHGGGDRASPDAGEVLLRPLLQGQVPRERERPGILRPQHHGARLVPQHLSERPVQAAHAPVRDHLRAPRQRGDRVHHAEHHEEDLEEALRDDPQEGRGRKSCWGG